MWPFRRKRVEQIHVCTVPGVEMRMTVNGRTILQGDMKSFHYATIYGANTGDDWYDLLNGEFTQFKTREGDQIGLEIRAIQTNGWGHGPDEHCD
jgi:hypothetical protein